MQDNEYQGQSPGLNLHDILFILFKHKGKILLFSLLGFAAAGAIWFTKKPMYQSDAKLMVRYVVDRSGIDSVDSKRGAAASSLNDDTIINSEIEILTSWDLAIEVAEAVSAEGNTVPVAPKAEAAGLAQQILANLTVAPRKGSNVIAISYKDANPAQAHRILQELVKRYYDKHLQVHRSVGAFDFDQEIDQVRGRLKQTEDKLKELRTKSGILSLNESTASLTSGISRAEDEFHTAETEFKEQTARYEVLKSALVGAAPKQEDSDAPRASAAQLQQYRTWGDQLTSLRESELVALRKYSEESRFVEVIRLQIKEVESKRAALEKQFPALAATNPQAGGTAQTDLLAEGAKLKALEAKTQALKERVDHYQQLGRQFAEVAPEIAELERKKELEEANYKYFESNLDKARIDEKLALDPSKMPNLSMVQKPSPAGIVMGKQFKIALGLAGGGIVLGLALAFFIEWILDRTVKRPLDLEMRIDGPLLMAIPYFDPKRIARTNRRSRKALNGRRHEPSNGHRPSNGDDYGQDPFGLDVVDEKEATNSHANGSPAPWETAHFMRKHCDSIRDRLLVNFEMRNMHHKPKLIAVAGFSKGAGTSTLASGLAAALSETGEGKVLLVDMNVGEGEVHPFFEGRPSSSLAAVLESNGACQAKPAGENLYLATVNSPDTRNMPLGLRRFYSLMPVIKATDFDYVIFDMPNLGPTSPTLGMAGFMDKLLLVVESERNSPETIRRSHSELLDSRVDASYVMNKVRSYAPKWIESDN